MIRIGDLRSRLTSTETFGLDTLVDLSRLVPVDDSVADVVRLEVTESAVGTLHECHQRGWYLQAIDGCVTIPRPVLALVAEVAGGVAEQRTQARDRFGRPPSAENALVRAGVERTPVISEAAVKLREAARSAAGARPMRLVAPWPAGRRWAAAITHDLDIVAFWPLFTLLRSAELARTGHGTRIRAVLSAAIGAAGRDPIGSGVATILERERSHDVASTWFILCGTPTLATFRAGDLTYRPESAAARKILQQLAESGSEIGLHGSQETVLRGGAFAEQKARLRDITSSTVVGVRQHFLRFEPASTPDAMLASGFRYDSTVGFPDRNGFRLGVADIVPVWNAASGHTIALDEAPFCWMDRALSKYQHIENPITWVEDGVELAQRCRDVEGLWVGIWHPNLVPALGFPGALEAYDVLLAALSRDTPWLATLADIVRWRSVRRSVRIRTVDASGSVHAVCDGDPGSDALTLEDFNGLAREPVATR